MTEAKVEREVPRQAEKKRGTSRLLILLLLCVAAVGGYFYFFGGLFAPEISTEVMAPPPPTKIKMPVRQVPPTKPDGIKEEVVSMEEVAAVAPAPASPPKPVEAVKPTATMVVPPIEPPAPVPVFALKSGSYLYQHELDRAIATIEKAGFTVDVSSVPETHKMTRLVAGHYANRQDATKQLSALEKLTDGAFLLAARGGYEVCAGSYLSVDKARRAADLLYARGIRIEEQQVEIKLRRSTLQFGNFADRKQAEKVAAELEKKGLKAPQVVSLQ